MSTELQLNIISAEKKIFSGKVTSVTLPGKLGKFSILPDHAPLVSSLDAGTIKYEKNGSSETVDIKSGFAEVSHNVVTVCVE
ncbi:MAG: ATP synthase F1 subunit epsilon [Dysgonomonas sp.]